LKLGLKRRRRPAVPAAEGPGLRVATYNIHTCVGVDRRYDPARIAAVLAEIDADIISLQEVDARRRGEGHLDQWLYLAEATGMFAIPGPSVLDHRGRFGNAILTRWQPSDIRLVDLAVPGHEPRSAIDLDLAIEGRRLRVVATHLGLRGGERVMQARRLMAAIGGAAAESDLERALLVMGDLNEWRGRRGGVAALERTFGRAPAPRTFPSWCPMLPLDRIFATAPATLRDFRVHRTPLARVASDHLPLTATLCWHRASHAGEPARHEAAEAMADPR
jgi:endonuclease/exonuclease/phosphatase family metal-dependent hydrolase